MSKQTKKVDVARVKARGRKTKRGLAQQRAQQRAKKSDVQYQYVRERLADVRTAFERDKKLELDDFAFLLDYVTVDYDMSPDMLMAAMRDLLGEQS